MSVKPGRVGADLISKVKKGEAGPVSIDPNPAVAEAQELKADAFPEPLRRRRGTVSINYRMDPDTHAKLRVVAFRRDESVQHLIDVAVRSFLQTLEP